MFKWLKKVKRRQKRKLKSKVKKEVKVAAKRTVLILLINYSGAATFITLIMYLIKRF